MNSKINPVGITPPWIVQMRVIKALILRDIRTRFFGNGFGYILAMMWPFTHMAALITIYVITGRVAPFGSNALLFIATAIIPVISFLYMSRFIMQSVQSNQPLLNFPAVKFVDILLARALLEVAAACCVSALMALALFSFEVPVMPWDPGQASQAFLATLLFGLGVGALNGVIVIKFPGWAIIYMILSIVLYATSGILFLPESFPIEIRSILALNPLLHAVEWMRESYYEGFHSTILNRSYVPIAGLVLLFTSLLVERGFRRFLHR